MFFSVFRKLLIVYSILLLFPVWAFAQTVDGRPCPKLPVVQDVDGNSYHTVQIGKQCWMKENLRTTKYADGQEVALEESKLSFTKGYRYCPNRDVVNVENFGYLYNWTAATRGLHSKKNPSKVQGICPNGWHVPSEAEWTQLIDYVQSKSAYRCDDYALAIGKSLADDNEWCVSDDAFCVGNDLTTNDLTGFSAVPAGYYDGKFVSLGYTADFWSSTVNDYGGATYLYLRSYLPYAALNAYDQREGRSVRCVHNEEVEVQKSSEESASDTLLRAEFQRRSCVGDSVVKDADGNVYPTVQIGRQCWMQENLRVKSYDDGTKIQFSKNKKDVDVAYRYNPMGCDTCVKTYGYLYNWTAVMHGEKSSNENPSGVRGICPKGWHVPSRAEWMELTEYVESQPQYYVQHEKCNADCALSDVKYWKSDCYITHADASVVKMGFNARPAGLFEGYFSDSGSNAYFWSSTSRTQTLSYFFGLGASILGDYHRYYYAGEGFSVRCLRDQ